MRQLVCLLMLIVCTKVLQPQVTLPHYPDSLSQLIITRGVHISEACRKPKGDIIFVSVQSISLVFTKSVAKPSHRQKSLSLLMPVIYSAKFFFDF